jgi:hypothetical protein
MLIVLFLLFYSMSMSTAECHYAESQYAESQYAESQYAECIMTIKSVLTLGPGVNGFSTFFHCP